ncbi:hypothetical protein Nepgr_018862 [Nepenthes gracilis]|uniref:Uncharacterized protein n=1 Tax=Nepenthes gracilis TaxID=150966 RepID=A0AAD3SUA4_NEPGR|nr:hypothetical protein Nepgr_018862 [Nepenthes gracilis]
MCSRCQSEREGVAAADGIDNVASRGSRVPEFRFEQGFLAYKDLMAQLEPGVRLGHIDIQKLGVVDASSFGGSNIHTTCDHIAGITKVSL